MPTPWDLLEACCGNARELVIAAPYIKLDALHRTLALVSDGASITCVTRWTPNDVVAGASDVMCHSLVTERGGVFKLHTRLHAKYYRCDDRVLIGSANLTATGLGYTGMGNLEILCEPGATFDSTALENELLRDSRHVTPDELAHWLALDTIPLPPNTATNTSLESTVNAWKPSARDPEHVWMLHSKRPSRIVSMDERRLAQLDLDALAIPRGASRRGFNAWVCTQLLASPFVESVTRSEEADDAALWTRLAETWSVPKSEAARSVETIRGWVAAFLGT